jgi:hypothetical protein
MACNSLLDHFKFMPIVTRIGQVIHWTGDPPQAIVYSLGLTSYHGMLRSNQLYLSLAQKQNIDQWLSPLLKFLG